MSSTTEHDVTAESTPDQDPARLPFLERFADRMNPILVKEVRQAMKSRAFVVTFMLLIGCCWLVSFIGAITVGASLEYYAYAERFFVSYFIPLTIAIGIVVPFLAYYSMLNERVDDTFEMLSITTLNARSIVNGKLTNAIALILLCFSAITPFIAFTSLLQGFRFTPVVIALVVALFASIGLCSIALLASTLAKTRIMQGIVALILLCVLGYATAMSSLLFIPGYWAVPATWSVFGGLATGCIVAVLLVLLFREVAVARITFQSDNQSTGVRLVTSLMLVFAIGGLGVYWWLDRIALGPGSIALVFAVMSVPFLILLGLTSFFACTEPTEMSSRVRQQVNKMPKLLRFFAVPWLPGCYRGYLFCLIHTVPIVLVNIVFWKEFSGTRYSSQTCAQATTLGVYLVVYAGLATLLSGFLHWKNPHMRSIVVRASFVAIIAFLAVIPHLFIVAWEEWKNVQVSYGIELLTSPYASFVEASNIGRRGFVNELVQNLMLLGGIAILFLILNTNGIIQSIRRTWSPIPKTTTDNEVEASGDSTVKSGIDLAERPES